jgi:energy-coupling factor transport system ATP-binding protein
MIEIKNLTFEYPSPNNQPVRVLDDISLIINEGISTVIMGSNGSGKTTLAFCINGLLRPIKGSVRVDDLNTNEDSNIPAIRRKVGIVFQNPDNQIVSATVEREIAFGMENLGIDYDSMQDRVAEMLQMFDLKRYRTYPPYLLSGGEKQRLALASVLAMQPQYLILDEPTSLLDPKSRKEIINYIKKLHTTEDGITRPITTLFITQFPEEAMIADRLVIMHKGKIFMDSTPEKVFSNSEQLLEIGLEPPAPYLIEKILNLMDI